MLNKAILMGRLTRDPEKRYTRENQSVANFTLAIDRGRTGQDGEKQTDFIDCTAWGRQADFVAQWFTKGMLAIVVGRMQSSVYEDKNGSKRTKITVNCGEVQFGESKKARTQAGQASGAYPPPEDELQALPDGDDVPFL